MVVGRESNILTKISSSATESDVVFYPSAGHGRGKLDVWEFDADLVIMADKKTRPIRH